MGKFVIFCAAEFDELLEPLSPADYLLAADGGLRHLNQLNLKPQGILGDFDSLGYTPQGAEVFPVEKDDTDAMLAARKGLELGWREFLFYGALDGPRLDHTVANFQALQYLADHGARGALVGLDQIVTLVKDGQVEFQAQFDGYLSVFCMGADAKGVKIRGLHYETENAVLTAGFPLGVSNRFVGKKAEVSVEEGSLLLIWERKNGLLR